MPRHDDLRELNHDDIISVASECLDEGVDAYEIALALWILRSAFTDFFGPRYRELLREIFDGPALPDDFSLYLHAPCATEDRGIATASGELGERAGPSVTTGLGRRVGDGCRHAQLSG